MTARSFSNESLWAVIDRPYSLLPLTMYDEAPIFEHQ